MNDVPDPFSHLLHRLAAEGFFAGRRGVAVWDASGTRLLHLSPEAEGLRGALSGADGQAREDLPARGRLRALAAAAPRTGGRLEHLRLGRFAPPVACLCRLAASDDGDDVLVLAFDAPGHGLATAPDRPAPAVAPPDAPTIPPHGDERRGPPHGTARFLWQTDAEGRFVHVSETLAEIVGPAQADILGRSLVELAGIVRDPGGLAGRFARQETFSGHTLYWRVGPPLDEVPVEMAGAPFYGDGRSLAGYRGFGLVRSDALRRSADAPAQGPADAAATAEIAAFLTAAAPSEQARLQGADEAAAPPERGEDTWFASIRDLVTETLSSAKAILRPEESREAPRGPIDGPAEPDVDEDEPAAAPPAAEAAASAKGQAPGLTTAERSAFREIARALGARFEDDPEPPSQPEPAAGPAPSPAAAPVFPSPSAALAVLDRIPAGILVHRGEEVLFANRVLLDEVGYDDVGQIAAEGGVTRLFRGAPSLLRSEEGGSPLALTTRANASFAAEVRLATVPWEGMPASLMLVRRLPEQDPAQQLRRTQAELRASDGRVRELEAMLDTATDGVIVLDESGRTLTLNRSAEALFGYDQREVAGEAVTVLFAPESHRLALDYLEGLRTPGMASLLNDGREVLGRVRQGGVIPLFMTMGVVSEGPPRKYCAVLRDITAFKTAEGELVAAKRAAEQANAQKSDLLAKISHEIRTPLSAIIGFAEVMLEERFGPIGNDRYKEYLKDVHTSGAHVISLVNDLLDLAKIEAGRMDLSFTRVSLNELVGATVTLLQPQAARDRIVMRTSFATKIPPVFADERSIRQIVLNLVSNAIKFTDAGGQVIVSTAPTDRGEVAFRIRDTGIGMTEEEIEQALEPFRQVATARKRGGTGLGLPLTKALVEANRGALQISSNPNEGTLVEVLFPPMHALAE